MAEKYLKLIFEELYGCDGLCVMAKGIGMEALYVKFITCYSNVTGPLSLEISSDDVIVPNLHEEAPSSMTSTAPTSTLPPIGSPSNPGVVFCLNSVDEEKWIHDELYANGVQQINFPKTLVGEVVGQDRSALYQQGGCFIATSRVIIHDLLRNIIHPSRIRGFLVYNAHKISESSIESFILRVYKNANRDGFVKAFTDNADALCRGFGKLESLMQLLYVQKLYLWPRFHTLVQSSLAPTTASSGARKKFEVIELTIPLSSKMSTVQTAILSAIETCINELKRGTPQLDPTLLTLENGLFYSFDTVIRTHLEPEWHKLSQRTKQLIADLATLRQLLDHLVKYDAITFHSFLLSVKQSGLSQTSSPSLWLTSNIANTLFRCSRDRLLEVRERSSTNSETMESSSPFMSLPSYFNPSIEIPPKWILLEEVLKEIKSDYCGRVENSDLSSGRVVLIVKDERMLTQIKDYLSFFRPVQGETSAPSEGVLHSRLRQFVTQQATLIRQSIGQGNQPSNRKKTQQKSNIPGREKSGIVEDVTEDSTTAPVGVASKPISLRDFHQLHLDQKMMLALEKDLQIGNLEIEFLGAQPAGQPSKKRAGGAAINDNQVNKKAKVSCSPRDQGDLQCSLLDPQFHISIVTHSMCHHSFTLFLDNSPSYIIMLDADIKTIRMIETYQSRPDTRPLKVYFLMYSESIEEHQYISALKREKKAFEDLINKKATLVISLPDYLPAEEENEPEGLLSDSRLKKSTEKKTSTIVVDIREFGSTLPSSLHLHGFDIQPVTLAVGDYILAPQICVERKGISDLFQSFNSGRLFSQAESMMRYYELMCLLIEFSPQRPFCLQAPNEIPPEIQINNICSKIALLALAFPSLSIIWSRSPHATIDIFHSLKKNFENPDVNRCLAIGNDDHTTIDSNCIDDLTPQDILLTLPGINSNNFRAVMNNVTDLAQLSQMTVQQLTPLIGPINAKKLVSFFKQTM